jgi:hypothetical protein
MYFLLDGLTRSARDNFARLPYSWKRESEFLDMQIQSYIKWVLYYIFRPSQKRKMRNATSVGIINFIVFNRVKLLF